MSELVYNASHTLKQFHQSDDFVRGCRGPIGCVAPDTLVITECGLLPISQIDRPMRVLSWNDKTDRFQLSWCGGSFPKGMDYLYRVTTQQGVFDAASHHRICGDGSSYQLVETLEAGDALAQCCDGLLVKCTSGVQLSSLVDVQHCSQTVVNSLGRYAESARRYGQRFLKDQGTYRSSAPSPVDAHRSASVAGSVSVWHMGDCLARLQSHIRHGLYACLKRIGDLLLRAAPQQTIWGHRYVAAPYAHNAGLPSQWLRSPLKGDHQQAPVSDQSKHSSDNSISKGAIVSIEMLQSQSDYWDMQVLETHNYVTVDGSIHHNSGKSVACAIEIVRRAAQQEPAADGIRYSRWVVVRNTYVELRDTTMKTWDDWCGHLGEWKTSENAFHLADGDIHCEVMFRALDRPNDVKKLLSLELTGAWINEAREIPRSVVDMVQGRVGRYPGKMNGGASWYGLIMDTNPPDNGHWWYKLFEEIKPEGWSQYVQPGGMSEHAENLKNLPGGREYYKRIMPGKDPEWIKVYVHGEYGMIMDGKPIYSGYRDSMHCQDVSVIPQLPIIVGCDFGLTPAATFWQRDAKGRWLCHDELVTEDMGAKRFGEMLVHHLNANYSQNPYRAWGDPAGQQRAQTDEQTVFQILRASGLRIAPAPTNDFLKRTEAVNQPLQRLVDGEPGMLIHPRCTMLRKAMAGGYCYKRIQVSGDERFRDVPDKNMHSHVAEAAQYALIGEGEGASIMQHAGSSYNPVTIKNDWSLYG